MTYEEIQAALEKQINYEELARLLELDLNSIADEIITDPTEYIQFQVFFDSGEFDTTVEAQAVGEGQGIHITPILVTFINGDYSTNRGPQFFSTVFGIEVLGFEKDRENIRKIFETYSYINQGKIDNEDLGIYTTTTLEFPVFGAPFEYKGFTRTQGFMRLFMSYMYSGQMSNEVEVLVDNEPLIIQGLNIKRTRSIDTAHPNGQTEVEAINKNQTTTISGGMLYDGSTAAKKILRDIKNLESPLNNTYEIKITYPNILSYSYSWVPTSDTNYTIDGGSQTNPNTAFGSAGDYDEGTIGRLFVGIDYIYYRATHTQIADVDTYNVIITDGDITISEGGVLSLSFSMTTAGV